MTSNSEHIVKTFFWKLTVGGSHLLKEMFDFAFCFCALILLIPFFILISIIILIDSRGKVIFKQTRIGKNCKPFVMYKFRSMAFDAEKNKPLETDQDKVTFKMKNDPRTTRFGRFIRRFSIDELPQLWNVLNGDMSLVGPRPPLADEVKKYSDEDMKRLQIKPGITCLWQVSGRSNIPFKKQVELDKQYIDSKSILLDIVILLKTIPAVLIGKGAY